MDISSYGFLSLLPPLLAIGLALWTRQVFIALVVGIASGFLILASGNPLQGAIETMNGFVRVFESNYNTCLLYTSPSPRDGLLSRMPSSA